MTKLHRELQEKAIDYLYNKSYWITRMECPVPIGYCDVWGIKSNAGDYETIAIEVKISRNDFLSRSSKYKQLSNSMANRHYFLCPTGLIKPDEIKPEWGLLWWDGEGRINNKKQAKFIEMTDRQKLWILVQFLSSKLNKINP